ncbi:hypothetical protein SASPL_138023 [Salvia splendens]|uniref:X8 domain-containing protein n=1 Tax=Salvia splendens TaxID=180675 RepID=A0A8X8ZDY2_SALSN|nr:hypothetical protein SASPL_138023 [Salvia splendens]
MTPTTPGTTLIVNPTSPVPPITTGPNPTTTSGAWCITNPSTSQTALQVALDYACGYGRTDCSAIQPSRKCWDPNTLVDHASYAFNEYYHKNPVMAVVASQRLPTPPQRLHQPQRHLHPPPWSYHHLAPQQPSILTHRAGTVGTETMGRRTHLATYARVRMRRRRPRYAKILRQRIMQRRQKSEDLAIMIK